MNENDSVKGTAIGAEVISPSQIKQTINTDVVVLGAGISGACAALSAIKNGSKTVLLEKGKKYTARGRANACVNSSLHKEAGVFIDREELISEMMKQANYRVDQRLLTTWVDQSGEAMDWLVKAVEPFGLKASLDEGGPDDMAGPYKVHRVSVKFDGGNIKLMSVLTDLMKNQGGDIRYNTTGVQLIKNENNRIAGVVCKSAQGEYFQFNAKNGVILSTGGYENNSEMMKKYLRPSDLRIERFSSSNKICEGDGHNMGLGIGADIDDLPHCLIVCNGVINNKTVSEDIMFNAWLRVDKFGKRFVNEDGDYCRQANANAILPGHFHWSILDSSMDSANKQWESNAKDGVFVKADSFAELAGKMKVDPEVFKTTVARYNELAKNKKDDDFGVDGEKMMFLGKQPFYAAQVRNFVLVSVSGLKINEKAQVLDKEGEAIPGLYASGNTSGGFFADTYPRNVVGVSHGRAITFGWIAGKIAAANKA
jgi:fumarate reductase flavoprotein subunit